MHACMYVNDSTCVSLSGRASAQTSHRAKGHILRRRFNATNFARFAVDNAKKIVSVYRGAYGKIKRALKEDHVLACKFENLVR